MSNQNIPDQVKQAFFVNTDLNLSQLCSKVGQSLNQFDDGELFIEHSVSESLAYDDKRLKNSSFNISSGFGLRAIQNEAVGYIHSSKLSCQEFSKACNQISALKLGKSFDANLDLSIPVISHNSLYQPINPINEISFEEKLGTILKIDEYLRKASPLVKQVSVSLASELQIIMIILKNGEIRTDIRPLVRLNVSVISEKNDRMERGSYGSGGRFGYKDIIDKWQLHADEALRQALVNQDAKPIAAGSMKVVIGNGWPGILLHEAIGHGLEGDFNRKKTSAFSELTGKQVASKGVTIVDDGTIFNRRGSLNVDDEGTPTKATTLIENGILKNYMQDRLNARLMGTVSTGNGRRESFSSKPMPRMTNTYMQNGTSDPQEIIESVDHGLYAVNFGGGQVDITSGKFVFSACEAYMIENGKITHPVKDVTLIGNGPDVLNKVTMIGNDLKLDPGVGTCGKAGQSVPVGVGQPTLLLSEITVGGTL